jgi:glucose-1-phosphate adenylyltransferase
MKMGTTWYRGTADAVRQNMNLISGHDIEDIVILSGDHIYKMNHSHLIEYHRRNKAALTISALRVKSDLASGTLGVLEADKDRRAVGFEEKPLVPKDIPESPGYCLASMGIYVFKAKTLLDVLYGEGEDFGKHIIPRMIHDTENVFVYDYEQENRITDYEIRVTNGVREKVLIDRTRDSSYWRDVGTIDSFYETSMDLVSVDPAFSLYSEKWPLRTYQRQLPPGKCTLSGKIIDSIVSDGCIISGGTVDQSVLSPGVIVERDAWVYQSVIFDDVFIEPGAKVNRAIIDKECRIRSGALIGFDHALDKARGCTVTENGIVVVPKGTEIKNNGLHLL